MIEIDRENQVIAENNPPKWEVRKLESKEARKRRLILSGTILRLE
jgi:hypothetical protein